MLKSSILNVIAYQTYLKSSWRPYWSLFLLIIPIVLFIALKIFQNDIAAHFSLGSATHGSAYYADFIQLAAGEVLWLGFFFLVTWILMIYPSNATLQNIFNIGVKPINGHFVIIILFVFLIATLLISLATLGHFPNSSDEYAYLFQAEMFSKGRLWEPAHDLPGFFYFDGIAQHDGILVSLFPPGWPLFLSAAFETGMPPYMVNPLLSVLTLIVFYFFARKLYGEKVAVWSLFALAFTGFFIFNSASYFSHISSLLVTLLFVCSLYLYHEKKSIVFGLLAGFFLGFVAVIRSYNALLIFVPFLFYIVYQYRIRSIYVFLLLAIGSLPCIFFLLSYNYSITGDAFWPVTSWAHPEEKLGFVNGYTFLQGVGHIIHWILLFFYWCSPGLLILYIVFMVRKMKSRAERFVQPEDYMLVALMIGYFFYYQVGGDQYGPRFLFEGLPFLIVFVIRKVLHMRERWAVALLVTSLLYAVVKFPFISIREGRIADERRDLYDLVDKEKISNAVILVSASTSPTRPLAANSLTRNDRKFQNDVIYALELPNIAGKLMDYYGDRSFYKYVRDADRPQGELIRIR